MKKRVLKDRVRFFEESAGVWREKYRTVAAALESANAQLNLHKDIRAGRLTRKQAEERYD